MITMKYFTAFVVLLTSYHANAENGYLPEYIKSCDYNDKELQECMKKQIDNVLPNFTKGIPELNVPPIDPVELDDIILDQNSLKLKFTQAKMHGLSKVRVTDFKVDLHKADTNFSIKIEGNLKLTAKYTADGQILILPIKGQGDALVNARNVQVNIDSQLKRVGDKTKGYHFKLISPNYKYKIQSTTFDLKNLFNGNKQLAEATLKFANQNWEQLMDDIAPPGIKQIVKYTIKAINKFFAGITVDRLFRNYPENY